MGAPSYHLIFLLNKITLSHLFIPFDQWGPTQEYFEDFQMQSANKNPRREECRQLVKTKNYAKEKCRGQKFANSRCFLIFYPWCSVFQFQSIHPKSNTWTETKYNTSVTIADDTIRKKTKHWTKTPSSPFTALILIDFWVKLFVVLDRLFISFSPVFHFNFQLSPFKFSSFIIRFCVYTNNFNFKSLIEGLYGLSLRTSRHKKDSNM